MYDDQMRVPFVRMTESNTKGFIFAIPPKVKVTVVNRGECLPENFPNGCSRKCGYSVGRFVLREETDDFVRAPLEDLCLPPEIHVIAHVPR